MNKYVYVRFTGVGPASKYYSVQGSRRYILGQNPTHYQTTIDVVDWPYLKQAFHRQMLEIPLSLISKYLDLSSLISVVPYIDRSEKSRLIELGYQTVGEVLADRDNWIKSEQWDLVESSNKIAIEIGYPPVAIPDRPVMIQDEKIIVSPDRQSEEVRQEKSINQKKTSSSRKS